GGAGDLYSLGAILHLTLTRRPPFDAEDHLTVLRMHLEEEPVPVTELRPDVPPELATLVGQMLAKRPEERPVDAEEVRRRLAPFLPGSTAARPLGPWEARDRKVSEKGGAGVDGTGPTEPPSASSASSTRAHTATPGTLRARMDSAQARADAGQYVMAARELRELLPDLVATFGPEHPDTLRARRRKAYAIGKSGQH